MTDSPQFGDQLVADITRHVSVVGNIEIAYRMTGPSDAPVLLMLHGFPGSSATFEPLMGQLGQRWRVIAPDYPGFGHSETPQRDLFRYTFDHLAEVIDGFIRVMGFGSFALYMFDFGAPVGMRLALREPGRVTAMISQNANIYEDGLGPGFNGLRSYWTDPVSVEARLRAGLLTSVGVKAQHRAGAVHAEQIDPGIVREASEQLANGTRQRVVLDLLYDYRNNLDQYPSWQAWLRTHRPPLLVVWGAHDPIFTAEGARAFIRDVPDTEVLLLDAGHFAALEVTSSVATHVDRFLSRVLSLSPNGQPTIPSEEPA